MSRRETVIRKGVDKTLASKILRTVHSHEGFWFYKAPGEFTGKNATSLKDFAEMLQLVDVQSINFHFSRGDFRRWIQIIIGDFKLAKMSRLLVDKINKFLALLADNLSIGNQKFVPEK